MEGNTAGDMDTVCTVPDSEGDLKPREEPLDRHSVRIPWTMANYGIGVYRRWSGVNNDRASLPR